MIDPPNSPQLCPACAAHIESSNLEWVQCGGISVGMNRYPLVWRLRDRGEEAEVRQRTKDLQKMAAMAREIHKLTKEIEELRRQLPVHHDSDDDVLYPPLTQPYP